MNRIPENEWQGRVLFGRGLLPATLLLLLACVPPQSEEPTWRPGLAQPSRDVTLLGVALASRVGSAGLANDTCKDVLIHDTVMLFPVVQVALGAKQQETLCFANTTQLGHVGSWSGAGWELKDRVRLWNRLKDEIHLAWYEVQSVKPRFRAREMIRYHLKPLPPGSSSWYLELTGRQGTTRILVRARLGQQVLSSGSIYSEEAVNRLPRVCVRSDTSAVAWPEALIGAVPYRAGSSLRQSQDYLCCDSRSLVASYLSHLGHPRDPEPDSVGEMVFKGFVWFGRLYDEKGRRKVLHLGRDVKTGDVLHFTTLKSYALVRADRPQSGYRYGGIPARLPLLRAAQGYPRYVTLSAALWSFRTLFSKSWFRILRHESAAGPAAPGKGADARRAAKARKR